MFQKRLYFSQKVLNHNPKFMTVMKTTIPSGAS